MFPPPYALILESNEVHFIAVSLNSVQNNSYSASQIQNERLLIFSRDAFSVSY